MESEHALHMEWEVGITGPGGITAPVVLDQLRNRLAKLKRSSTVVEVHPDKLVLKWQKACNKGAVRAWVWRYAQPILSGGMGVITPIGDALTSPPGAVQRTADTGSVPQEAVHPGVVQGTASTGSVPQEAVHPGVVQGTAETGGVAIPLSVQQEGVAIPLSVPQEGVHRKQNAVQRIANAYIPLLAAKVCRQKLHCGSIIDTLFHKHFHEYQLDKAVRVRRQRHSSYWLVPAHRRADHVSVVVKTILDPVCELPDKILQEVAQICMWACLGCVL